MICSSENRFFTSNLLVWGNWTPNPFATQLRGDVVCGNNVFDAPTPAKSLYPPLPLVPHRENTLSNKPVSSWSQVTDLIEVVSNLTVTP